MDKLKKVIEEYGRWSELATYIQRIESHIEIDFSLSLENAKALLETIGKEICKTNEVDLGKKPNLNNVLKKSFSSLGYSNNNFVKHISRSLVDIGQQVGNLRNIIGTTSHGKTLEEIKQRNNKVDILTREFLIRNFEIKNNRSTHKPLMESLEYSEAEEFNDSWDDSFGEFTMGDYSYTASEILFNVDKQAYVTEYKTFNESKE